MDTMESTKIVGGLCGALLVFMLAGWAAESMYHVGSSGHHDGEEHVSGYPIEVAVVETGGNDEPEMTLDEMMAMADADKGKKVFSKCKACHKVEDGANGTGPHLFNVVNRGIGDVAGYEYSGAMASFEGVWDVEALNGFLIKPSAYMNGTKMSFAGLKKEMDRANLIKYLETLN
ncbi:cytochrome c family protein [Amylibacter sp. IMCC11727]|uniref:c-type cytochrome n=1 Tax=Amylibacter sp. IMCC11727 TaxID=3039851 RepID=UPI00244E0E0C|nr:cytochrome c family protein [Amylibacter sp. IMCC11727]WGI21481.1 cytochrome c family protein [Amylibacter sp. IMCC11727]